MGEVNHRPILPANQVACKPVNPCPNGRDKHHCARFQAEIGPGGLQTVGCAGYLDPAAFDPHNKPAEPRQVKPWPKG